MDDKKYFFEDKVIDHVMGRGVPKPENEQNTYKIPL